MRCRLHSPLLLLAIACGSPQAPTTKVIAPARAPAPTSDDQPPPGPTRKASDDVVFDVKVPEVKEPLSVYKLQPALPEQVFLEGLTGTRWQAGLDRELGTLEFHPDFREVRTLPPIHPEKASELVKTALEKLRGAIPRSDVELSSQQHQGEALMLSYARAERGKDEQEPDEYLPPESKLLYVPLRGSIDDRLIDGQGSRFSVAVDANGQIRGAVYHWRRRTAVVEKAAAPPAEQVEEQIRKQLVKKAVFKVPVRVRKIDVAYYDANSEFLQPVFRYQAEFQQAANGFGPAEQHIGYVPFSTSGAVLAELKAVEGNKPNLPILPSTRTKLPTWPTSQVAVGRYVTLDDSVGWQRDSDDFIRELATGNSTLKFLDAQNYAATPWLFSSRKDWFVNSVDIALVEGHGYPLGFTTFNQFSGDLDVTLDVPLPAGYGAAGGGRLKHLIVHSCRVVAAPVDAPKNWAEAWWDVFNGMSSVVGYRTSMFIEDGAGPALAKNLRRNSAVVPAWLGSVASLNAYGPNGWATTECTNGEPMGRASAIAPCDAGVRARANDKSTPRPSCLEAWWFDDSRFSSTGEIRMPAPTSTGKCHDQGPKTPVPPPWK